MVYATIRYQFLVNLNITGLILSTTIFLAIIKEIRDNLMIDRGKDADES